MAAGLENTALMASWGAAIPTPPIARETGPTPIRLSPLVARAREAQRTTSPTSTLILKIFFIAFSPFFLSISGGLKWYMDTPHGGLSL